MVLLLLSVGSSKPLARQDVRTAQKSDPEPTFPKADVRTAQKSDPEPTFPGFPAQWA